jgi:hypothetical protein
VLFQVCETKQSCSEIPHLCVRDGELLFKIFDPLRGPRGDRLTARATLLHGHAKAFLFDGRANCIFRFVPV